MKILKTDAAPLGWRAAIVITLGAVISFHLGYSQTEFRPLHLLIFAYLGFLFQFARLNTTRRAFYFGLATGFLCIAPQLVCFWNIFGSAAVPLWLVLSLWTGLFTAFARLVLHRFGPSWTLLLIPFLWTGLEYFRSELYHLKFSWLNVGYAFADWLVLPMHDLGMYGMGFLAAICASIFLTMRLKFAMGAIAAIAALCLIVSGITSAEKKAGVIRIAGIQMEFPFEKDIPQKLDLVIAKHPEAELIVLSEYTLDGPVPDALKNWCKETGRYLIVGGKDPAPSNFYDSGFVVSPDGEIVFKQGKSVPIQFFKDGLPAPEQKLWNSPWGKIGICICYDLSYTRVTDQLIRLGAQALIVPTMDVTDWGKRQHELHALVAPVRAAEYGIPIFRLASSGISQAVDRHGRVVAEAGFPGENEIIYAELSVARSGSLPFDRWLAPLSVGITEATLCALAVAFWLCSAASKMAARNQIPTATGVPPCAAD